MKYEIEEVSNGVWVHTKSPDTGERVSVYVNACGSPDGVIVDFWRRGGWSWVQSAFEPDECVHSVGLEWCDFTGCK